MRTEVVTLTLPTSVTALIAAEAAAELVLFDEQTLHPLGGMSMLAGVERARVTIVHDEDVSLRLDIKETAGDTYIEGTPVDFETTDTPVTNQQEFEVSGLRFFRVVAVIGATGLETWLPAVALVANIG
jgi:hypothetical protein